MKVSEVMTKEVIAVRPEATLRSVAGSLAEHKISGQPVVDEHGVVLGVVSEADFLVKEKGPDQGKKGLLGLFFSEDLEAKRKLEARTVGEAMTSPVISIGPDRLVHEAARKMTEHQVNRLLVMEDGTLLGIITRADLVRAFARPDAEILHEIQNDVILRKLWISPEQINVTVENGEVALSGHVATKTDATCLVRVVELIPGVVSVESFLRWEIDA